jgi:hypothetical protein
LPKHAMAPSLFDLIREPDADAEHGPETTTIVEHFLGGERIIYRDRDGRDWPGVRRFTLGTLASVTLDEPGLTGSGVRSFRIDPNMLRPWPGKEATLAQ